MTITRLLAQLTVTDSSAAEAWYSKLFDREPDARPMPGLLEWHLADTFGVQVWAEPARAGKSSLVLDESDLPGFAARLQRIGIAHPEPQNATTVQILPFEDPDGNRIVATAPLAAGGVTRLGTILDQAAGSVPGVVALVDRDDDIEVHTAGSVDIEGSAPMERDTLFRIASLTKPIVAAALMTLVDGGALELADRVDRWLPELSTLQVVREPGSPIDDVVPAVRPITVDDLLSSRAGWGFPSDFSWPAVGLLFTELGQGPPWSQTVPAPDEWLATLSHLPLLYQPGEKWLYNTCSDLQGVLIARVSGRGLPEFLAERLFEPLGMVDTGFAVPAGQLARLAALYESGPTGPELADPPEGRWSRPPAFPSGSGGLVSTADDLLAFGRMVLHDGAAAGKQVLSADAVRRMTTNCLTDGQRQDAVLFLEGQGWGYGGSVDVTSDDPWTVPGRYGWVGGTGTSAHVIPARNTVAVLLTQLTMSSPTPPALMRDFWTYSSHPDATISATG